MKKILLIVLILLMGFLVYQTIFQGINLGGLKILSVTEISQKSEAVDVNIDNLKRKIDSEYPSKVSQLTTSYKNLQTEKQKYEELSAISTDSEIEQANQVKNFKIEFLWARIGTYATSHGVKVNLTFSTATNRLDGYYNINFTVTGKYIPIIQFISSLEDDPKLSFAIDEFKLKPQANNIELQSTFKVQNLKIDMTNAQLINSNSSTTNNSSTNTNTNTNTDTNTNTNTNTNSTTSGTTTNTVQ